MSLLEEALKQHIQRQVRLGVIKSPPITPKQNYQVPAGYRLVKIKRRGRKLNDQELLILNRLMREAFTRNSCTKKALLKSRLRRLAIERFRVFHAAKEEGLLVSVIMRYFKCNRGKVNYGIKWVKENEL